MKKILADPRVSELSDERPDWGYWFYLKRGFINSENGAHVIHQSTLKECMYDLKHYVTVCQCDQCMTIQEERDIKLKQLLS